MNNVVVLLVRTCADCGSQHRTVNNVVPLRCLVCGSSKLSKPVPTDQPFPQGEQGALV